MVSKYPNPYRASLNKVANNLLAELVEDEIIWHNIEIIGRGLVILAGEAFKEQVKQRREYIKSEYEGKE